MPNNKVEMNKLETEKPIPFEDKEFLNELDWAKLENRINSRMNFNAQNLITRNQIDDYFDGEYEDKKQVSWINNVTNKPWVDIRAYGAIGETTDNTIAIQAAIDSLSAGQWLLIPPGSFLFNTALDFDPPDGCGILCMGILETAIGGAAFTIGKPDTARARYYIQNLKVNSSNVDHTAGRIGIKIQNLYQSYIDIRSVTGFETGVQVEGSGGIGFSYNELHLGKLVDNKYTLKLTAKTNGWCNENNFYGGQFKWSSNYAPYTGWKHIWIDHYATHSLNSNRFYSPSLEAPSGTNVCWGIYCEGRWSYFHAPRYEMGTAKLEFTANSRYNVIFYGYNLGSYASIIDGSDYGNCVYAYNTSRIVGGNADGVLRLRNLASNSYPTLVIENTAKEIVAQFLGNGKGQFKGGIGVGNSAVGNTLGNVVKKMEVFDEAGNSLGFVPVYDAITQV